MKKSMWVLVPIMVLAAGCATRGAGPYQGCPGMQGTGPGPGPGMGMQSADTNGDGMLSKDEFMKFHEGMFDVMKNRDGVIDLKAMPARRGPPGMMGGCGSGAR
ncbi:hypothetical protein GCM10027343_24410 [Noviherbaspirillum agri]